MIKILSFFKVSIIESEISFKAIKQILFVWQSTIFLTVPIYEYVHQTMLFSRPKTHTGFFDYIETEYYKTLDFLQQYLL